MEEIVAREFQAIRDLIASNERARDAFDQAERERHTAEKVELDARLNRMNEFRQAMADQSAKFIQRPEFEESKAAGQARYDNNRQHIDARSRSFITSGLTMLSAGIAAAWLIVGLKIDNTVAPLRVDLEQDRQITTQNAERLRFLESEASASTQADTASRADRSQINERLHQIETATPNGQATAADVSNLKKLFDMISGRIGDLRNDVIGQKAALVEIETQFCNTDYMRNLMHAQDLRMTSMIWAKVFPDSHYPTDNAYYPRIGKCGDGVPTGSNG